MTNTEQTELPEGFALEQDDSGQGPDLLLRDGHVVAVLKLEENYPVPTRPGQLGTGHFNADRWFWDPQPQDFGHVGKAGGYEDFDAALKAAVTYAQKREA